MKEEERKGDREGGRKGDRERRRERAKKGERKGREGKRKGRKPSKLTLVSQGCSPGVPPETQLCAPIISLNTFVSGFLGNAGHSVYQFISATLLQGSSITHSLQITKIQTLWKPGWPYRLRGHTNRFPRMEAQPCEGRCSP